MSLTATLEYVKLSTKLFFNLRKKHSNPVIKETLSDPTFSTITGTGILVFLSTFIQLQQMYTNESYSNYWYFLALSLAASLFIAVASPLFFKICTIVVYRFSKALGSNKIKSDFLSFTLIFFASLFVFHIVFQSLETAICNMLGLVSFKGNLDIARCVCMVVLGVNLFRIYNQITNFSFIKSCVAFLLISAAFSISLLIVEMSYIYALFI